MGKLMEYKGYHAKIEYSDEDETFVGRVIGLADVIIFDGDSIVELTDSFHMALDEYLEFCKELGKEPDKEFKGSFNVRIEPELHKKAVIEAEKKDISLNQYVAEAIEQHINMPNIEAGIARFKEMFKKSESFDSPHPVGVYENKPYGSKMSEFYCGRRTISVNS